MASPDKSTTGLPTIKAEALFVAALLAIIGVISWPGMTAPLLLDDLDQLSHVEKFKSWKDCLGPDSYQLFRPFKNLIFHSLKDASLFKWHAFVLAVYGGAAVALYALFRRLTGSPAWAFAGALLWASCPTQVSTAVWMSAVNLSMAMAFSCACIIFHDSSQARPGRNASLTALACLFLFLAQVSYETAVAVPALCVLVDLLRKRPVFSRPAMLRYGALGLVTIAYLAIRSRFGAVHSIQNANFGFAPETQAWQLSVSAPWFLWRHFSMWLMPAGRMEFCGTYIWGQSASSLELAAAWAWLVSLLGGSVLIWKRQPMIAIGLLWFLVAGFPPSNFIPIWCGPITDYYLFFPGVGLAIALVGCARTFTEWMQQGVDDRTAHRRLIAGGLLAIVGMWRLLCIPLFWLQADLWNRPVELYLHAETARPHQYQLQALAARELMLMGRHEEGKALARKSHETAPWFALNSMILGSIAIKEDDFAGAEKQLRESLEKSSPGTPIHDYSRLHLADALQKQGTAPDLVRETLLPLLSNQQGGYHLDAIRMLIDCYLEHKQPDDALRAVRKAIALHPEDPQFQQILRNIQETHPGITTTQ